MNKIEDSITYLGYSIKGEESVGTLRATMDALDKLIDEKERQEKSAPSTPIEGTEARENIQSQNTTYHKKLSSFAEEIKSNPMMMGNAKKVGLMRDAV